MGQFLDNLFSSTTLPGTILLGICVAYWLLLIAGAVDLEMFDFDLDAEAASDGSGGWGMTAFRFLNINDVPLMIWLSIFAVAYVATSTVVQTTRGPIENYGEIAAAGAGSAAIALAATKLLTQPLRGKFEAIEPNVAATLVGRLCVITTVEVSERFGQARVEAEGAPLLLNVRGPHDVLTKDDVAVITGHDPVRGIFFVEPISSEPPQREAV